VGDLARRDVPTCRLEDRVGDERQRVRSADWDLCVVVNERNVVLGRLREKELGADPAARVEQVMEAGPTTYRPDRPAQETARYLAKRKVAGVLITTSDGELIGLFRRDDIERGGEESATDGA
jgi:CBS domain-containing protein